MELDAIPVFVKVAQLGSFTQASKALNMPNTTVSAKVAQLERALGTTLIQRTTRKLSLTEAGRLYLERAVRALGELQAAQAELNVKSGEIAGQLKITASVDMGQSLLPIIVERYLALHPKMKVQLIVTNRVVDLIGEGVDVAIRAGKLKDSSLIAKSFVGVNFGLWASKAFLKRHGAPKTIEGLLDFPLVHFTPLKDEPVEFTNGKAKAKILTKSAQTQISVDDFGAMKALAQLSLGICLMPDLVNMQESADARLIKVLPEWYYEAGRFSLVYPSQEFVSPKLRAFIDVAGEVFKKC